MARILWVMAALVCHVSANFESQTCNFERMATIQPGAQAMLGGLIGMHEQGKNGYGCGLPTASMQSYEALRYALDLVNKKDEFLNGEFLTDYYVPGIRMGMRVMDTCSQEGVAVAGVGSIFPTIGSDSRQCTQGSNVTLGTSNSGVTGKVATFSNLFEIPVVSYMATAPDLTYSGNYPNFLRTIPPDDDLMQVMGRVLKQMNWNYVVVVYEDTAYGRQAYDALRPVLAKEGICLTAAIMADPSDTSVNTVNSLLEQVVALDTVGTIFLGGSVMATALLERGSQVNDAGKLQWVFTDSIPLDSSFSTSYARGIIAIVPASRYIVEFEDHWVRLDEENPSSENPWFKDWYMDKYQCNLIGASKYASPCANIPLNLLNAQDKERQKRLSFVQDQFVEPAVHSVFTYAYALRQAQERKCGVGSTGVCDLLANMTHEEFLNDYLKKVDFTYAARERVPSLASDQYAPYKAAKRLQFDSRGDIFSPSFSVWNYNNLPTGEENSTAYKFRDVGNFINNRLSLTTGNIRMYTENRQVPLVPLPTSPCPSSGCSPCLGIAQEMKYYYQPGDIVINGVFSLHNKGPSKFTCGGLLSAAHPLYLEAMIYAVKRVNMDNILQGVQLGGLGIDDCMDSELSSNFIMQVQQGMLKVRNGSGTELDPRTVEAYTAAYNTPLTLPLAGLMDDIFMQPMVGYRASSSKLDKFNYYLKTIPGIEQEFRAIIMIMKNYGWHYTQVVYSANEDPYNEDDVMLFRRMAAEAGICVLATLTFEANQTMVVDQLANHPTVRPVVLLMNRDNHKDFLQALSGNQAWAKNDFIVTTTFGSDGTVAKTFETETEGYIAIDFIYSNLTRFFSDLATQNVGSYRVNPWFEEWFESVFNCYVGDNPQGLPTPCSVTTGITNAPKFERDLKVVHVINAVYAIARGLDSVLEKYCGASYNGVCAGFVTASRANKGKDLRDEILQVSFNIEDTNPLQQFRFSGRSGAYPFTVYSYRSGQFNMIGTVTSSTNSISLQTNALANTVTPTCPRPCVECLYMFAYQKYWYLDGDLIIPAVFDIHYKGTSMYNCGMLRDRNGVQYTEAFKYALDFVNGGGSGVNLTGVRLGGLAFDGCTSPARSSAIINGVMGRAFPIMDNAGKHMDISKLLSWLTYDSESTMEAADMLKMIGMPLVSPGATAPQLLDKVKYSTFFRTIPSDTVIAKAMANFINARGWKYVITLNAPDAGSRETRDRFREYLKDLGICVIADYEFETDGAVNMIMDSVLASTTQVVAVFADPDRYVPEMLQYKETLNPDPTLIFISNRYWHLDRMGLTKVFPNIVTASNSLSFRLASSDVGSFVTYLRNLTLSTSTNPWLPEYYQALFKCDLGGNQVYKNPCSDTTMKLEQSQDLYQHMYALTTINAVHALAVGVKQVLTEKCGAGYTGVCSRFLTDSDTLQLLMTRMDNENFTDVTSVLFDFVEREANRGFELMQHVKENDVKVVGTVSTNGDITPTAFDATPYNSVISGCADECQVCKLFDSDFIDFSLVDGDVFIVGLFDVHNEGRSPYTCGSINEERGLQLLEAFNYALEYINKKSGIFQGRLPNVKVGGIGIDVCKSPTRAANLVANIHSGNINLTHSITGRRINRREILAYVGPFDTPSTIRVADVLNAIGMPQVTYGATGLQLQDADKYSYLLRSVPADDKQSRAIISYLKNFNLTNIQVVSSYESIGETMREEFKRLASLNLVCIKHNYTIGDSNQDITTQAAEIVTEIVTYQQSKVVVLLMDNPLPILQAAGRNPLARDSFLWVATDKWGYDKAYLTVLSELLGDRNSKKNVIIFDIETADVPLYDQYLDGKNPDNYTFNPWFQEFYEDQFGCSWSGGVAGIPNCDRTRGLPRDKDYVQDPYVLYVANAVFSAGVGIDETLKLICPSYSTLGGLCRRFDITGDRRDMVLSEMRKVNFTDDTLQPFYFEPTGESSRGYHIYNVTATQEVPPTALYMYENVGSFNDTHFLKLDITYEISYQAYCMPYDTCVCVNPFPQRIPSRYMLQPSPSRLNLVYIGDVHQASPSNPFACSDVNVGSDFFKMMAFFYAINRVNQNLDNRYPESLRLGGVALDTCSSTLRLDQDIFNLLGGYPLCDSGQSGQVVPPSSIVAFVPDGNANSIPVSRTLASTRITTLSPSATSPQLREFVGSEHFLSIVPPDDLQAKVMLEVLGKLNWDYASVIFTDEPGMVAAKNELLRQAAVDKSACMGQALGLRLNADVTDAEAVLDQVSQQVGARAVILFTLPAHTRLLLQAAKNRGQTGRFIWIGTTAWGRDNEALAGLEQQASGAIVMQPYSAFVEDFRSFVKTLTFTNRQGIPDDWFEEIYQTMHTCKIAEARRSLPFSNLCSKRERIIDTMVPYDPSVLHTVIAVYMVAQGLNQIQPCQGSSLDISACISELQNRNDEIYLAVLNAQWNVLPSLVGNNTFSFTFDSAGYGNIGFDILNYHSSESGYVYSRLGRYTDNLVFSSRTYQGLILYDQGVVPTSNCVGTECRCQGPTGIYGIPNQWMYNPRQASLVVTEEGRTYQDPATGALHYVETIPSVTSRFQDMWGVAVATLAAIGIFVSLALFIYLLVVYPVRGGTSVLGYVLAFSIILLYGLVFAFVAHVNVELCGLRRFGLGFVYAIAYSALFVKLVDCWRSRRKEDMFTVKYNKLGRPMGLFMVTVLLVLVQVIINAEWLILEEPRVVRIFYNDQYWPRCTPDNFYDEGLVLSLCYIMVLILLTVLLGFCSFNSTKNHREARWILGMGILSVPIWVVWCAWAVLGAVKTRDAAVAVGLLINATVLLLLGPVRKLYLLNKYQALIEEEERTNEQEERANKANDYSSAYGNQYDNAPQFQDRTSNIGSTRGPYRYPPSSIGHSGR
ncbi:hypothetical protein V1264_021473 [Littorina saxatilis]|uniref:G-protein coupled receptors family 3 profile domain-containing protein n=1 Tax=Littorina saxatilis TaxID=31220 RepID=A0AAN9AI75_9CAEN